MADSITLIKAQASFFDFYREMKRLAEESCVFENRSATQIQRLFRGSQIRLCIATQSAAATEIKRVVRGHWGRCEFRIRRQDRWESRQRSLYNYFIIQIQKCYRGFHSRKYRQNHFARRAYFKQIADKNEEVLKMMAEYAALQETRDQQTSQQEKEEKFRTYAENLHHLVGTKNIRGIYKPPEHYSKTAMMSDYPVEDHIRGVVKDLLKSRGIAKTGLIKDINGTRKIPYIGLKNRLSLQASAPYDMCKNEKIKEHLLHKVLISDKGDFLAGRKPKNLPLVTAPPVSEPYADPGSNPFLIRGVPRNQEELENSKMTGKPLFVRHLDIPYHTSYGGNRSTAYPNDLFEVIADAQETGGMAQRQLGFSSRFGVSDRADNRVKDGSVAMVPHRLSAVQHARGVIYRRKNHIIRARENLLSKSQNYNQNQTLRNEECSSDEGSRESAEE